MDKKKKYKLRKILGAVIIVLFLGAFCFATVVNGLIKTFFTVLLSMIIGGFAALGIALLSS